MSATGKIAYKAICTMCQQGFNRTDLSQMVCPQCPRRMDEPETTEKKYHAMIDKELACSEASLLHVMLEKEQKLRATGMYEKKVWSLIRTIYDDSKRHAELLELSAVFTFISSESLVPFDHAYEFSVEEIILRVQTFLRIKLKYPSFTIKTKAREVQMFYRSHEGYIPIRDQPTRRLRITQIQLDKGYIRIFCQPGKKYVIQFLTF